MNYCDLIKNKCIIGSNVYQLRKALNNDSEFQLYYRITLNQNGTYDVEEMSDTRNQMFSPDYVAELYYKQILIPEGTVLHHVTDAGDGKKSFYPNKSANWFSHGGYDNSFGRYHHTYKVKHELPLIVLDYSGEDGSLSRFRDISRKNDQDALSNKYDKIIPGKRGRPDRIVWDADMYICDHKEKLNVIGYQDVASVAGDYDVIICGDSKQYLEHIKVETLIKS